MTIKKMENIKDTVEQVLIGNDKARDDDNYLYMLICESHAMKNGISLKNVSVLNFFLRMNEYGFPTLESVGRARRKVQEEYPELCGSRTAQKRRKTNEEVYKESMRQ